MNDVVDVKVVEQKLKSVIQISCDLFLGESLIRVIAQIGLTHDISKTMKHHQKYISQFI